MPVHVPILSGNYIIVAANTRPRCVVTDTQGGVRMSNDGMKPRNTCIGNVFTFISR